MTLSAAKTYMLCDAAASKFENAMGYVPNYPRLGSHGARKDHRRLPGLSEQQSRMRASKKLATVKRYCVLLEAHSRATTSSRKMHLRLIVSLPWGIVLHIPGEALGGLNSF